MLIPPGGGKEEEGWVPSNRVMGMCAWMASHLHYMNDYNGVDFGVRKFKNWTSFTTLSFTIVPIHLRSMLYEVNISPKSG